MMISVRLHLSNTDFVKINCENNELLIEKKKAY